MSTPLPPSLSDIDNPTPPPTPPPPPTPTPAPPAPTPPDPPLAPPANEVEGLDADGNLLEGYKMGEDGKPVKAEPANDTPEYSEEDVQKFYEQVRNLSDWGDVEIDLSNSEDPLSPAAVATVLEQYGKVVESRLTASLKAADPRGYAYLLHRQNGGTDEDFFSNKAAVELPELSKLQESVDMQTAYLIGKYVERGIPKEIATSAVDSLVRSNAIAAQVEAEYQRDKASIDSYLANLEKTQQEAQKKAAADKTAFIGNVQSALDNFRYSVDAGKREEFNKFVKENVFYNNGVFYEYNMIAPDKLNETLEAMFFRFMKGDLSKIVSKEASTKALKGLRLRVGASAASQKSKGGVADDLGGSVPLDQI